MQLRIADLVAENHRQTERLQVQSDTSSRASRSLELRVQSLEHDLELARLELSNTVSEYEGYKVLCKLITVLSWWDMASVVILCYMFLQVKINNLLHNPLIIITTRNNFQQNGTIKSVTPWYRQQGHSVKNFILVHSFTPSAVQTHEKFCSICQFRQGFCSHKMATLVQLFELIAHIWWSMLYPWKELFTIIIELHNYNDMAKTWMQNFIYILLIKGQSGAHKTVNQILQELKNTDLI